MPGPRKPRQNQEPQAKEEVAKATAKLIQLKQVVILDSGTTTFLVAQHLPPDPEATIITGRAA